MSYQIDPNAFNWGQRIQEGMQQSQDNRRKNALLDLEQRQVEMQENKLKNEMETAIKSRSGRAAFLKEFGFPEELADDPDAPELIVELAKIKASNALGGGVYGKVNPGDYDPASLAAFDESVQAGKPNFALLNRMWAPINPKIDTIAGVPTQINPVSRSVGGYPAGGGSVPTMAPYQPPTPGLPPRPQVRSGGARPLSSLEAEAAAAQRIKEAEGFGSVTGQETAKRQEAINTKIQNISNMDELLDLAGPLVQASTGSLAGAGIDKLTNFFGVSLSGDQAIGALQPIAAALLANVPRMEGPQSDADRIQYERAAGDVANPTLPREKRLAAIRQIRTINAKYRALNRDTRKEQRGGVRRYNPATGKIE